MHYLGPEGPATDDFHLADDAHAAPVPPAAGARPLLPLAAWQEALARPGATAALWLDGADDVDVAALDLARCDLVAVAFGHFTDGRGYSLARLLRRHGYRGDLRAVGDVRRDQVFALARCGFTSFGAADAAAARELARGCDDFSLAYQPAADGRATIAQLRTRRRPAM